MTALNGAPLPDLRAVVARSRSVKELEAVVAECLRRRSIPSFEIAWSARMRTLEIQRPTMEPAPEPKRSAKPRTTAAPDACDAPAWWFDGCHRGGRAGAPCPRKRAEAVRRWAASSPVFRAFMARQPGLFTTSPENWPDCPERDAALRRLREREASRLRWAAFDAAWAEQNTRNWPNGKWRDAAIRFQPRGTYGADMAANDRLNRRVARWMRAARSLSLALYTEHGDAAGLAAFRARLGRVVRCRGTGR